MTKWVAFWPPPGYNPLSENWITSLCDADNADLAKRAEVMLIRVSDHQWESSR